MTEKTANYTDEMVARMHEVYDPVDLEENRDKQVEALAIELNRTVPSVRAKLVKEGVYVSKAKVEAGKASIRKSALVAAIAAKLETDEDVMGSLEKATKNALQRVLAAL